MKQSLNIFAKDVRRFYPEILLSLAITLAFVKIYPRQWAGVGAISQPFPWLPDTVTALVPVSWWVLIARIVHAESLVGERQFWITRPYQWPKLLAAKALFISLFLYAPFFIAQCVLLKEAGIHPLSHVSGILYNLLLTTGILVLPLAALAAVTKNFAKMLLAMLIVVVYGAGVAYLTTLLPSANASNSFGEELTFILPVSVFIAVIVLQYATRRTLLSRTLLCALALTIAGFGLFGPEDAAMRLTYPELAKNQQPIAQLTIKPDTTPAQANPYFVDDEERREVELSFPVQVSGIAPGTAVKADNARVRITTASGDHWASDWQGVYLTWLPGKKDATISLKVNRRFFERAKAQLVSVELSVALTALRSDKVTRMTFPTGPFSIPGGSVCASRLGWSGSFSCRSPLRQPPLMLVTMQLSKDCSTSPPPGDGDTRVDWIGTLDTEPAEFGITSVWTADVAFERFSYGDKPEKRRPQLLCPGSPISFTRYVISDRKQQRLVVGGIPLGVFVPKPAAIDYDP